MLAEAYIAANDYRGASAVLREAIERVEAAQSFFYAAELWRLQGRLRWIFASNGKKATECSCRSIDIAKEQGAKSLELRAATSMAQLFRQGGEHNRGVNALASVYRSFKVNRETPDVLDARLELEELEKGAAGRKSA